MNEEKDEFLLRHLELCQEVFEEMQRNGSWPWRDSQNDENLLESEHNQNNV